MLAEGQKDLISLSVCLVERFIGTRGRSAHAVGKPQTNLPIVRPGSPQHRPDCFLAIGADDGWTLVPGSTRPFPSPAEGYHLGIVDLTPSEVLPTQRPQGPCRCGR
jgi:hypothetical protein